MGLEARVHKCDDALHHLSSELESLHRCNFSVWRHLWNWLKQMWEKVLGGLRLKS
jgi:hypothetical protein